MFPERQYQNGLLVKLKILCRVSQNNFDPKQLIFMKNI